MADAEGATAWTQGVQRPGSQPKPHKEPMAFRRAWADGFAASRIGDDCTDPVYRRRFHLTPVALGEGMGLASRVQAASGRCMGFPTGWRIPPEIIASACTDRAMALLPSTWPAW